MDGWMDGWMDLMIGQQAALRSSAAFVFIRYALRVGLMETHADARLTRPEQLHHPLDTFLSEGCWLN